MGDLTDEARALLAGGATTQEAFIALWRPDRPYYDVTLAVGVAVGNSVENMVRRLEPKSAWSGEPEADEIDTWAETLEASGYFDLHAGLSAAQEPVAKELWRDFRTLLPMPSGVGHHFLRLMDAGHLDEARRELERLRAVTSAWAP
ncbi:hypothetical protein SAMN04488564_105464 [Lentzea waywayandensis]|uniref:Uncharacterized protein n=1 Tax=Lentzea waywayandensis TaxID=84724 RepID=A0A1I6ETM3_9PSEU|nr:hypothetical protein [Lentzea waywayandensis]SFR21109.1 hypothetical protein SAMN04488564_105464 [Lentzea waywayandensis]